MLKDVRIHLDDDEAKQQVHEKQVAELIMKNYRRNQATFQAYIPSLYPTVREARSQNISVFANKRGELNIVNYNSGRTFYGLQPQQEIHAQYHQKRAHCTYCDLNADSTLFSQENQIENSLGLRDVLSAQPSIGDAADVVVVLGIGIAEHIRLLLEHHQIKHLIVYEPEVQYFHCAVMAQDWRPLFELAKAKGTQLYFQLGNSGATLFDDISELTQHNKVDGFYLYRHYNTEMFNCLEHAVLTTAWKNIGKNGLASFLSASNENALPLWSPVVEPADYQPAMHDDSQFQANIAAFRHYFPAIAKEFSDYKPGYWITAQDQDGGVNVFSQFSMTPWFSDKLYDDAEHNLANFSAHPNKDGLVLGYNGTKLKHYIHFEFVAKAQKLLDSTSENASELPEDIRSLILFGVGPQLAGLSDTHNIEKLFICEPNRDLFYASLFYLDWATVLQKMDDSGGRLYINVGDDGSNLFKDLINQFYSVGPYILASTYFYQTYHNETLVRTISQLREQLQVVIAMGENFDHARYGIAHTHETIKRHYPLLKSNPASKMSLLDKEVPVFVVGNGPSLDSAIAAIKEWREQAIVISCGTALMPLYKNGIVPDFHAEIEQNRSTFDWCSRVGDFEYLKKINILSCNGLHPDTCDLFKNTYLAFKEGESATVSALNILGRDNYEELQFAFPTVSNFVMNVVTLLGFEQIYLFGVDLGFVDKTKHHSMQSGYYDDNGKQKYDYEQKNNTNLVVPGNFEKFVFTKYEFKVSKMIIERSLAQVKADCFNTANGARIEGTRPLSVDNILLTSSAEQKQQTLAHVESVIFQPVDDGEAYEASFADLFSEDNLEYEFGRFLTLANQPFAQKSDVIKLTDKQKEMLLASYTHGRSLLFYYLYGTVNYANSMFSKLAYASLADKDLIALLNEMRELWVDTLNTIYDAIKLGPGIYDYVSSFTEEREQVYLRKHIPSLRVESLLTTFENEKLDFFMSTISGNWQHKVSQYPCNDANLLLCRYPCDGETLSIMIKSARHKIVLLEKQTSLSEAQKLCGIENTTFLYLHEALSSEEDRRRYLDGEQVFSLDIVNFVWIIKAMLSCQNASLIVPKFYATSIDGKLSNTVSDYSKFYLNQLNDAQRILRYPNYFMVAQINKSIAACSSDGVGNRGGVITNIGATSELVLEMLSQEKAKNQLSQYDPDWWRNRPEGPRPD